MDEHLKTVLAQFLADLHRTLPATSGHITIVDEHNAEALLLCLRRHGYVIKRDAQVDDGSFPRLASC